MKLELHVHVHMPEGSQCEKILQRLQRIEEHMASQNEAIQAFADQVGAAFTMVQTSLDAISADQTRLLEEIEALKASASELTPENAAKLDAIVASAQALVTRTSEIDARVPEPPVVEG